MKIYFASDHAGFDLKQALAQYAIDLGYETEDLGPFEKVEDDDYPDWVSKVAEKVSMDSSECKGVVIGGSGQGEAIVANRFKGVRAVVFNGQYAPKDGRATPDEIALSREHNDANILSLGARFLNEVEAKDALKRWLEIPFSNDTRHLRRLQKIDQLSTS